MNTDSLLPIYEKPTFPERLLTEEGKTILEKGKPNKEVNGKTLKCPLVLG